MITKNLVSELHEMLLSKGILREDRDFSRANGASLPLSVAVAKGNWQSLSATQQMELLEDSRALLRYVLLASGQSTQAELYPKQLYSKNRSKSPPKKYEGLQHPEREITL